MNRLIAPLLFACLSATQAIAAPAVVQEKDGQIAAGAAGLATAAITTTAGHLLVGFFTTNPAGTSNAASSIDDSAGNGTYTTAISASTDSGVSTIVSYVENSLAITAGSVNGHATGGPNYYSQIIGIEISGTNSSTSLDLHPANFSASASNSPSLSLGTPSTPNGIACASIQQDDFGAGITVTESAGWTTLYDSRPRNGTPSIHIACMPYSSAAALTYNPSFSGGATPAVQMSGVSFKAPGGAAAAYGGLSTIGVGP